MTRFPIGPLNSILPKVFLTLLVSITLLRNAQPAVYDLGPRKVRFELPSGWQAAPNLFGLPLVLLGKMQGEARPTITAIQLGKDFVNEAMEQKLLEMTFLYEKNAQTWTKNNQGTVLEFFKPFRENWKGASRVQGMGFRYTLGGLEFVEHSFLVICGSDLFQIKSLLRKSHENSFGEETSEVLQSFSCN